MADEASWSSVWGSTVFTVSVSSDTKTQFNFENDNSRVTLPIQIQWKDVDQAKRDFLGFPQVIKNLANISYISRSVPYPAPFLSAVTQANYLFATRLSGYGAGVPLDKAIYGMTNPSNDFPRYRLAMCEVEFETLPYDIMTDQEMVLAGFVTSDGVPDEATLKRYVTVQPGPGMEYLQLPQGGFKFVGPVIPDGAGGLKPAPLLGGPGKLVPNYDLTLTWHMVPKSCVGMSLFNPQLNAPPIDICLGKVNKGPVPSILSAGFFNIQAALTAATGTGYQIGDLVTISGGSYFNQASLRITSVDGAGGVLKAYPTFPGLYSNIPANPAAIAGGHGAGANFNLEWGNGWPVGTLLFTGGTITPIRSTSGERLYTIDYRFKFVNTRYGHQGLYYQGTPTAAPVAFCDGGYFEVSSDGTTNFGIFNNDPSTPPVNIYGWEDFSNLFRVPS